MNKVLLISISIISTACTTPPMYKSSPTISHRLGEFTIASSLNVQNLNYSLRGKTLTKGEHCVNKTQQKIRTVVVTDKSGKQTLRNEVVENSNNNGRLKLAMDKAIRNGQKKGIRGDVLVNVRINKLIKDGGKDKPKLDCYSVEGDLVSIKR